MQARQKWIVASAALLLLFILSAFPAGLAYRWFAPPQLRLSGIDGSVWRGTAIEGAANDLYLRNLEWSFSPLGLLTGKVAYLARTELAGGHLDARIAVGPGGSVTLSDLAGTLALEAFEESFQLKGFEGRLILDFERLTLADGVPREAVGTIAVQGLLARKLSSAPIGDFRAQFVTGDDGISGVVSERSAAIDRIRWSVRSLRVRGLLRGCVSNSNTSEARTRTAGVNFVSKGSFSRQAADPSPGKPAIAESTAPL
jgi:hypothetical protein